MMCRSAIRCISLSLTDIKKENKNEIENKGLGLSQSKYYACLKISYPKRCLEYQVGKTLFPRNSNICHTFFSQPFSK